MGPQGTTSITLKKEDSGKKRESSENYLRQYCTLSHLFEVSRLNLNEFPLT